MSRLNSRHLSCFSCCSRNLSCLNRRHLSCLTRRHVSCLLVRKDRCLLLRQDRCLLLRQDRCLLLRQDRCFLLQEQTSVLSQHTMLMSEKSQLFKSQISGLALNQRKWPEMGPEWSPGPENRSPSFPRPFSRLWDRSRGPKSPKSSRPTVEGGAIWQTLMCLCEGALS